MKKTFTKLLCLSTIVFSLAACGGDDSSSTPTPTLNVSPSTITLDANGTESDFFDIESNGDWTIEIDKDWVTTSVLAGKGNKSVEVNVTKNEDPQKRTANITVVSGNTSRRVRVTQEAGLTLTVTPSSVTLDGEEGSTGSFTVSTSGAWKITDIPSWIRLSGTEGTGNTPITVTTTETNRSDASRSATLKISADTKVAQIDIVQSGIYPADVNASCNEDFSLSDGLYFGLSFGSGAKGYTYKLISADRYDNRLTEESAYLEVTGQEESKIYTINPSESNWCYYYNLTANTEYVLCVVAYKLNGSEKKWGKMLVKRVKTKLASNNFDVFISDISYTSDRWTYYYTKGARCHHFYSYIMRNAVAEYYSDYPGIAFARLIKEEIKDNNSYDYLLNDGSYYSSRDATDYAILIAGWGVSDTGDFSNNVSLKYKNTSSSASEYVTYAPGFNQLVSGEPKEWKMSVADYEKMKRNVKFVKH
jgi:hypothetical protein